MQNLKPEFEVCPSVGISGDALPPRPKAQGRGPLQQPASSSHLWLRMEKSSGCTCSPFLLPQPAVWLQLTQSSLTELQVFRLKQTAKLAQRPRRHWRSVLATCAQEPCQAESAGLSRKKTFRAKLRKRTGQISANTTGSTSRPVQRPKHRASMIIQ